MAIIVITATSFCRQPELRRDAVQAFASHDLRFADDPVVAARLADGGPAAVLVDADPDVALIGRDVIDEALLARLPRLRALALYGVGHDNVDLEACRRRGVAFLLTPGVNAGPVAEHSIGLMLAVLHNIARTDRLLRQGTWLKDGGTTLAGKTVGIVGCGAVGSAVAHRLSVFDCSLLLCDLLPKPALATACSGRQATLEEVLTLADVVTLHVPLTGVTQHLINSVTLARMRPGSVVINTSRGAVVDPRALREALESGHLRGAALDVFEIEPMLDTAFAALPTLVSTPHIAGNAHEAVLAMGRASIANLLEFIKNRP